MWESTVLKVVRYTIAKLNCLALFLFSSLFPQEHPELLQLIKLAIEKSVNEWISPVIERAIKIAVTTCEQIVKKVSSIV